MRSTLFALLFAASVQAAAQSGVLYSPLPEDLETRRALEVARQVLLARGWRSVTEDVSAVEVEKDRSALRVFIADRSVRFSDLAQRPRGAKQRNREDSAPALAAVSQFELDALRTDLAAAYSGQLPLGDGKPLQARGYLLLSGIPAGVEAERIMAATRNAFIGRRWDVAADADGALIARIRGVDVDAMLRVFLADGELRYIDGSTDRQGAKAQVPERWLTFLRNDLRATMSAIAIREARPATPRPGTAKEEDPVERLRRLKMLLNDGLITPAEYEAKRAEILKGL